MVRKTNFFPWLLATLLLSCGSNVDFGQSAATATTTTGLCIPFAGTSGAFTFSGTALYEDKTYDANSFTGVATLPVRYATVDVLRCSDSLKLASASTDINGNFTVSGNNTGSPGVQVRVYSNATVPGQNPVIVTDLRGNVYAMATGRIDERTSPALSLTAPVTTAGAAFNLLDVGTKGIEYMIANLALASPLPPLDVVWRSGFGVGSSYFSVPFTVPTITINSTISDPDEYDDTVMMHEMGHFVAYALSKDTSPGGIHYLFEPDQDARLAWSEGWGGYFSGAALGSPIYLDTNPTKNWGYDLETVASDPLFWALGSGPVFPARGGSVSENDVAAFLWDLVDTPATDDDGTSGLGPNVLTAFTALGLVLNTTHDEFWRKLTPGLGPSLAAVEATAALNGMDLTWDGGLDDTFAGATVSVTPNGPAVFGNLAPNPFFLSSDTDYYLVTLAASTPYTFRISYQSGGLDAMLALNDPAGANVASDDNLGIDYSTCGFYLPPSCPRNGSSFDPAISYTPPALMGGVYQIWVKHSAISPPYAGQFGAYALTVTSP